LPPRRFFPPAGPRRDLWVTTADVAAYSLMVGFGETYLPAFALALGLGPVAAGLTATVPILVGAVLQLVTPAAVSRLGTNRGWVVACTAAQAASFVPFIVWALRGHAQLWEVIAAASLYWSAGMAGVPAWNSWIGTLVPIRLRTSYFARRNRLGQFAVCIGFVLAGLALQFGESRGAVLPTFAGVFVAAAVCRLASTALLAACGEPRPPERHEPTVLAAGRARRLVAAARGMAARPSGRLVAFLCCFLFGAHVSSPYFTPYMLRELGFSYHAYMLVFAASFLTKALVLPSLGRLASRIGSVGLLWGAVLSITPLALLWLPAEGVPYLIGVQVLAGGCWAAYELAVALLLFEAVTDRERTGVVTIYNLGMAVATVAGAACGGLLLRSLGTDRSAYAAVFVVSTLLRLAALPLARRLRAAE
jgi:MFS family permease